jgi:tRNA-2-methylthio-N6-dimethylallyladenosine synthase
METYSPQKYYITTFGCQANEADSNTMAGILEALGFERTDSMEESDIYIVNTCSVRQKSEDKAYGIGKELKELTDDGKETPFVVMAGCMVGSVTGERQRYAFEELKKRTPWVQEYINPHQIMNLPEILFKNGLISEWAIQKFNPEKVYGSQKDNKHVFINISTGCDNFCAFCVVPYSRGAEKSRSKEEIIREIQHYLLRGYTDFTLCAQNVNSWGLSMVDKFDIRSGSDQKLPFAELLREIHNLEGVEKIDFLSSNPFDFTSDLIDVFKLPKISNYLHMAVQSGNNEVLKRMNRRHTIEDFYTLIERIRLAKPDLEIGTDIIVGFPGETEEEFLDTIKLFEKVKFNVAFISIYSPRKGTPSEKHMNDDVPLSEKKSRHARLMKVWQETKSKQNYEN